MLTVASALVLLATQTGTANTRIQLNANWLKPDFAMPTVHCADRECVKMKITSGQLSGMEMDITPSLKGHAYSAITINFHGQSVSTLLPGNQIVLDFYWNVKRLNVAMETGKMRNEKVMSFPFWKELNGDVLSIDFKKEE